MIDFEKLVVISNKDILEISEKGLQYENANSSEWIDFETCKQNYALENIRKISNCIGKRDITARPPFFDLYTNPITRICFVPKNRFKEIFAHPNTMQQFHDFQKKLAEFRCTTLNLS